MNVEIRIPISPTPHFFRQIEYQCKAFAARGGLASQARFAISVGDDCEPYDLGALQPWSAGRVDWHWVDREQFRRLTYHATTLDRYVRSTEADVVVFLDADTMLVRNVDDILESIVNAPAIAGVIAHVPPFPRDRSGVSWQTLFDAVGRRLPAGRFQHSGWGAMLTDSHYRFAPPYYNYGAVFFPATLFAKISRCIEQTLAETANAPIDAGFRSQLALTLAMCDLDLPRVALDLRYNYPNDEWADELHKDELEDVRIIHYLREHTLGPRRETWGSEAAFRVFLERRDLVGSNELLRRAVADLHTTMHARNAS